MNGSHTEFPSVESLDAWAQGGEKEAITFKQGHKWVACIVKVKKDDVFHYFKADSGHFSLLATSSKNIFAEKTDE